MFLFLLLNIKTYFGVDVNAVKDTIHRRALQTMIETYGQTPLQLFSVPHMKKSTKHTLVEALISTTVEGMLPEVPKECTDGADEGLSFKFFHYFTQMLTANLSILNIDFIKIQIFIKNCV